GTYGGAISNSGTMTVRTSHFAGNEQELLSDCTLLYNNVCGGGAIANLRTGTLMVESTTFDANTSDGYGGGILNKGEFGLTGSTLSANSAEVGGGALANAVFATGTVTSAVFSGNQALFGGGIYNNGAGGLHLVEGTLENNTAAGAGGGLFNKWRAELSNVTFSGNAAANVGGAIVNGQGAVGPVLTMTHATLSNNLAGYVGAALVNDIATARFTNVTIAGNRALSETIGSTIDNRPNVSSHIYLINV